MKKTEDLQKRSDYLTNKDVKKTFFTRKLDQKRLALATIKLFPTHTMEGIIIWHISIKYHTYYTNKNSAF